MNTAAHRSRRAWLVVVSLFFTLFFIFGSGYNTAGVFFTPVIRTFGWSRARMSTLQTALALAAGVSIPLIGWLLDRIEARITMAAGAAMAGCGFITASLAHSYPVMIAAYLLIGLGIGAATLLPCSMVVANWFGARRGLAMGLAMAGTSAGGMVMTLVSDRAIRFAGWRFGYLVLAVPAFVIVIPLVLLLVRTRPERGEGLTVAEAAGALAGLEVGEAVAGRSFWLMALGVLCFSFSVSGTNLHAVPYLIGIGYAPARAAVVLSLGLAFGALGKLLIGWTADRVGGRTALAATLFGMALGISLLIGARHRVYLAGFVAVFGLTVGAPLALIPLVAAESLGLKRFGTLYGLIGVFHTLGAAVGPVAAGRIFDVKGSYLFAFESFIALLLIGSAAILGCIPLPAQESAAAPVAARA
ncbi:MAG TPA: MFS transporter [Candidatus Binataceae bacterium]|nr:MFS transporter [Candidatus Binataceae bacterium]